MQNNKTKLIIIILVILAIAGGSFWYFVYGQKSTTDSAATTVSTYKIDTSSLKDISQPTATGQTVSPDEPDFGRDNPFAPYQ